MSANKLKILADENMPLVGEIFAGLGEVVLCSGRDMRADDLAGIDVLLVRSVTRVNRELLADSSLKFVGSATIGMDHVDRSLLQKRGICFANAPGCNADAVVDYVLSVIFTLADRQNFDPAERIYGIVGVGNVGGRLQHRLNALGFKVFLNDPPRAKNESGFIELDELVEKADFICLHTPLTHDGEFPTHHLFDKHLLQRLRKDTVLLNAGRGPVVDNKALLEFGEQRPDLDFVLDVWEFEPLVDPALASRCALISPHIAGYSLEWKIRGSYMLYQALAKELQYPVTNRLDDFLPAAELRFIEQHDQSALDIIRRVYDPYRDDEELRDTLGLLPAEQMRAFDRLRKNYPVRREFSSLKVQARDGKSKEVMVALGFQAE